MKQANIICSDCGRKYNAVDVSIALTCMKYCNKCGGKLELIEGVE